MIPNPIKDPGGIIYSAAEAILKEYGCEVRCGTQYLTSGSDVVIVFGGDGSVLRTARIAAPLGVPLLGINMGRVGYMTEIEPAEIDRCRLLFEEGYRIEKRMMLSVEILRGGKTLVSYNALNDAVVSNGVISRMIQITLNCEKDGEQSKVGSYHADGLIAATPTGSTAYSLSAGGPVIDPGIDCICVTPVSAHSLAARPMIFSPDSVLTLDDFGQSRGELYLTVDGRENVKLCAEDTVRISRSDICTKLIRLGKYQFFDLLGVKLSE